MDILEIRELLEDEDLLEMVNAGLLPWVVVDDYKGEIWSKVFTELAVRNDLILRNGGHIGFAFRENSPELAASLVVTAREIGRETVQYVANFYKYYLTYRMSAVQELSRAAVRKQQRLGTENTEKQQKEIYND